ncbi:MAG: hypothetical protein GX443_01815 [Deltaproteobacteria bacterium]|nr:hypothetical protein [Deltaproteobacteria bacterium]
MKRLLLIFLLLAFPACASFQETWKENSATAPDGSAPEGTFTFSIGTRESTPSEEKTDLYEKRESGPADNLSIGISNSWQF